MYRVDTSAIDPSVLHSILSIWKVYVEVESRPSLFSAAFLSLLKGFDRSELDQERGFETTLDFCETEPGLLRRVIVALMQAIASDRVDPVSEYPLVVRNPAAFGVSELDALARLSQSDRTN